MRPALVARRAGAGRRYEDAEGLTREQLPRELLQQTFGELRGDVALGAFDEVEAERIGAGGERGVCVLQARDATDFHVHVAGSEHAPARATPQGLRYPNEVGLHELNEELPEELQALWRSVDREGLDPAAALSRLVVFLRAEPRHKGALKLISGALGARIQRAAFDVVASHLPPKE